jgi:hypothetical protein
MYMMIDIPDSIDPNIPEAAKIPGGYRFTLRAVPGIFNFPQPPGIMAPEDNESLVSAPPGERLSEPLLIDGQRAFRTSLEGVDFAPYAFRRHQPPPRIRPVPTLDGSNTPEPDSLSDSQWLDLTRAEAPVGLEFMWFETWDDQK